MNDRNESNAFGEDKGIGSASSTLVRDHYSKALFASYDALGRFREQWDQPDYGAHTVAADSIDADGPIYNVQGVSGPNRPIFADVTVPELRTLYEEHETITGLADALDRGERSVRRVLVQLGIHEPKTRAADVLMRAEVSD